jgi:LmbE family N-acetylglucosaminyl deacetylase
MIPTLIVAPHPDDETLGAGGLIHRLTSAGVPVSMVAVTDGERAYADAEGMAEIREEEQHRALLELGVPEENIHRLRLPDSDVSSVEEQLIAQISPYVRSGMHVVAPWELDFHPDHEACGRAAKTACRRANALLTSYVFWTWHRGTPETLHDYRPRRLELDEADVEAKNRALLCHQSQLKHRSCDPVLPENLLAPARRRFEVYLPT